MEANKNYTTRELFVLTKTLDQCERYSNAVEIVRRLVMTIDSTDKRELTTEERGLLSLVYKNLISSKRGCLRLLQTKEKRLVEENKINESELLGDIKKMVEQELWDCANDLQELLQKSIIPNSKDGESIVCYRKMSGDYYRYIAEFSEGEMKKMAQFNAQAAYENAMRKAEESLPVAHPTRLGLCLNYSVFFYEILGDNQTAVDIAKKTFEAAVKDLEGIHDEVYKDSTLILQLMRDNLNLWESISHD
eukprot:GHVP01043204.1.p1 GENE.GHVP01043204.1~~GHVP01043204.1.p1  ORF type:complete len:248 (+),score=44.72 GHVP01043204.1:3-746(+)